MQDRKFIRNDVAVEVDGLRGVNRYTVRAMYDARREDARGAWWELEHVVIDEFAMTWDEIQRDGGPAAVRQILMDRYGADCMG